MSNLQDKGHVKPAAGNAPGNTGRVNHVQGWRPTTPRVRGREGDTVHGRAPRADSEHGTPPGAAAARDHNLPANASVPALVLRRNVTPALLANGTRHQARDRRTVGTRLARG